MEEIIMGTVGNVFIIEKTEMEEIIIMGTVGNGEAKPEQEDGKSSYLIVLISIKRPIW